MATSSAEQGTGKTPRGLKGAALLWRNLRPSNSFPFLGAGTRAKAGWRRRTPVKPAPVLLLRGDGYSVRQSVVLSTGLPQRAALLTSWGNPHSAGACTCAHAARTEFFDVCGHSVTSYVGRQPLAESAPSALPFLSAVLNSVAETFVRPGRSALPVALLGRFQNSVRKPAETSHLSSSIDERIGFSRLERPRQVPERAPHRCLLFIRRCSRRAAVVRSDDLQNLHCIFPAKTTAISLQIYCDGLAEWPARPVAGLSGRSPSITAALKIVARR